MLRKENKLPADKYSVNFKLEYGTATLEMHKDSINKNEKILIIDDLIDFGGDSSKVGKPTKRDIKRGKATLINLLGYNNSLEFAESLKNKLVNKIKKYGRKSCDLLESLEYIVQREV